jgi:hypothetical protein
VLTPAAVNVVLQRQLPVEYRRLAKDTGLEGLGVVPLVVYGAAAGGAGALAGGQYAVEAAKPWYTAFAQWIGLEDTPELPVNPGMASNRAPIAPQTREAMTTWTPEQMNEALAQRDRQYGIDLDYLKTMVGSQRPGIDAVALAGDGNGGVPTWVYLAGAGALIAFFALRK